LLHDFSVGFMRKGLWPGFRSIGRPGLHWRADILRTPFLFRDLGGRYVSAQSHRCHPSRAGNEKLGPAGPFFSTSAVKIQCTVPLLLITLEVTLAFPTEWDLLLLLPVSFCCSRSNNPEEKSISNSSFGGGIYFPAISGTVRRWAVKIYAPQKASLVPSK